MPSRSEGEAGPAADARGKSIPDGRRHGPKRDADGAGLLPGPGEDAQPLGRGQHEGHQAQEWRHQRWEESVARMRRRVPRQKTCVRLQ